METETKTERQQIDITDLINPTEKQLEFLLAILNPQYKYLGYGGAKGGGKSYLLRWAMVSLLFFWFTQRGIPNVRTGIFCEDYNSLKDRQIGKISEEFPNWMGHLAETKVDGLAYHMDKHYGGGKILLRNLDDPGKYDGVELAAIGVDQLEKNPIETFQQLRSIMRYTGTDINGQTVTIEDTKFIPTFNPGGIGADFCKGYWITGELRKNDIEGDKFYFLQAKAYDNPYLSEGYLNQLRSLPPAKRKAFLDGDWDTFEGQFFDSFNADVHVKKPFDTSGNEKIIAMDYGNMTVAYLISRDKFNNYFVEHEFIQDHQSLEKMVIAFHNWLVYIGAGPEVRIVGDTNMFDLYKLLNTTLSPADHFKRYITENFPDGIRISKVAKRSLDRNKTYRAYANDVIGELLKYEMSMNGMFVRRPSLYIFANGRNEYLIKQLPRLIQDPKNPDDFLNPREAHGYDALKMGITSFDNIIDVEEQIADSQYYQQSAYESIL